MKVIHIVENLDKGAVENWLVRTFLESKKMKSSFDWTFYCILGKKGRLDDLVLKAGGNIIYSPVTISKKLSFLHYLRKELKRGHYDILHAHHDFLSGFYLVAAVGIKFKSRFLHIHNNDRTIPVGNKFLGKFLSHPLRKLALATTDTIIGISKNTLTGFNVRNHKHEVIYYGVDFSLFRHTSDQLNFRREINVPQDAKLLLFVGRMNFIKNPCFVVEVLGEVLKTDKNVYAIFIGKGELENDVIKRAAELGISSNIRTLGWRDDVPQIMKSCDLFVFPRIELPKEGLGLVVVEAQAAGLPMFVSKGIPTDAIVIDELANFLPLNVSLWAEKVLYILNNPPKIQQSESLDKMMQSDFELKTATQNLLSLYN